MSMTGLDEVAGMIDGGGLLMRFPPKARGNDCGVIDDEGEFLFVTPVLLRSDSVAFGIREFMSSRRRR